MSNQSQMVVATKYKLLVPINIKQGTWNESSAKEEIHTKVVARSFVEERNSHKNNELYVIDEEATIEFMEQRKLNIKANNLKLKRESTSTADLVEAIQGANKPKNNSIENMSREELIEYSLDNGVKQHPKAGKEKMIETINKFNS